MLRRLSLFCGILIVAVIYVLASAVLYHAGVKNVSPVFHNDFVVFGIPAVLALDGFVYITWKAMPIQFGLARRLATVLLLSVFALVVSWCFAGFIIFNLWGS